jgi:hypothetical protein
MPLPPNSLSTWARLKDELGLTDDTLRTRGEDYLGEVADEVERLCNRVFRREAGITEKLVPGDFRIVLARPPIISIASIEVSDVALDAADYVVEDAAAGIILRETGWTPYHLGYLGASGDARPGHEKLDVEVTYEGGYVLPATQWTGSTFVLGGGFVRPSSSTNQHVFRASGDGTTGASEPSWPASVGGTVVDGGVTWTNVGPRTLPRGLERLGLNGAVTLWRGRGKQRGIRSETVGSASRTYDSRMEHPFFAPEDLLALEKYARPVMVSG